MEARLWGFDCEYLAWRFRAHFLAEQYFANIFFPAGIMAGEETERRYSGGKSISYASLCGTERTNRNSPLTLSHVYRISS